MFLAYPPGALGKGQKVKYHLISITKSISKILNQTLCVFSHERFQTYQTGFSFCGLSHAPGEGLWGAGARGHFFSNMVMLHIKSTGMTSRTGGK